MKNKYQNGKIYIIAGYLKGRIINTFNHKRLRPTTNRMKETIFNWISQKIHNAYCLDCFSGSGALGIESISRYAKFATLLEIDQKIYNNLYNNIKQLNIKNINIIRTNTLTWLKINKKKYDIIFLDPPFKENTLQKTIFLLEKTHCIKKSGYIYIENLISNKNIKIPNNWKLWKKKYTSKISYAIYQESTQ
ncbi:16S rRNA (guanine(966)-N(2))-methyltransferase RsmD [Buchnera aphidicola]|uniref:16S rRNA (guanine(966)-N(2))-methyltransferase RsmD n=1 Tax=Buchnera aphidicola TaxID=9 RepID=UPI0034643506